MYPLIIHLSKFTKPLYASSIKQSALGISTAIMAARSVLRGSKAAPERNLYFDITNFIPLRKV
jgi:hypothetical protein